MAAARSELRVALSLVMLGLGAGLLAAAAFAATEGAAIRKGGTFRLSAVEFDAVDPAVAITRPAWMAQNLTCTPLMTYPDRPAPTGFRVVPGMAASWLRISRSGKTYMFTIRRGFRFSDGTPVTARNFEYEIKRLLDPRMRDLNETFTRDIAGVRASGRTLVITLKMPAADLTARLTIPPFCPVPLGLPVDPEGVGAPLPGSGPYYAAS